MRRYFGALGIAVMMGLGLAGCAANSADMADAAKAEKIILPSGTRLSVTLKQGVSTNKSSPGDEFTAVLAAPVEVLGKTVLEKGILVRGRVLDVQEPGRVKGRASMQLALTSIDRAGEELPIETKPYVAVAQSTKGRDTKIIAGSAGAGAAIGAILGGGKGALTGAAIGGGAGTGTVLATKGDQLHYPPETRLSFTLAKPAQI